MAEAKEKGRLVFFHVGVLEFVILVQSFFFFGSRDIIWEGTPLHSFYTLIFSYF